jgi:FAD binding domain/Berberine and berberine like
MTVSLTPSSFATSSLPGIVTQADPAWDQARQAWNLAVDQRPAAIVRPVSEADVIAAVDFARLHGLRVAAQSTGHGAAPLGCLADTLLVSTRGMREVRVDPAGRVARVQAGARWQDVVEAAAQHGLAALAGSSPTVGAAGYTLGGGQSWLGRTYGFSANNVQAIELVTADGRLIRADGCTEPDLFWALRGGGGSFGVVTAVELRLFPITEVYAGLLWWPATCARDVLQAWRQLTDADVPDEFSTTARLVRFPAAPDVPASLRGRSLVIVDIVHLGAQDEADALILPLRVMQPEQDTISMVSMPALARMHLEPEQPVPGVGDGLTLAALPADAVDRVVDAFGQPVAARLMTVELRQLGGELSRSRPGNGALAAVEAPYALFTVGMAGTPADRFAVRTAVAAVMSALGPWAARRMYLSLAETSRDPASFWSPEAYDRLRRVKAAVDPDDLIRSNHPIPPAMP